MTTYQVVIEQDEDGVFCASVPALPGCYSNGSSYEEALTNIKEAVGLHVDVLREHGDPIPPPRPVGVEDIDIAV
jgi:predicted RNase H-like HicB family nuclease